RAVGAHRRSRPRDHARAGAPRLLGNDGSAPVSRPREGPLAVLAVIDDADVAQGLAHVVGEEGDELTSARTVEEAVATAQRKPFDVAFVELRAEAGAALALCHHLP